MATVIDPSWTEIQTGLYQELVVGTYITYSHLYSADGYCFYDVTVPEFNQFGDPIKRIYMSHMSTPMTDVDEINARFLSIPIEDGFEIAGERPEVEIK